MNNYILLCLFDERIQIKVYVRKDFVSGFGLS